MRKLIGSMVIMFCIGAMISVLAAKAAPEGDAKIAPAPTPAATAPGTNLTVTQSVYVCPDCHVMALKAGKCPMCQKQMTEMYLVGVKDGKALLCSCAPRCSCDLKGVKDGKCACGKDVVQMSAKGMYVCPDGYPEISDKPGKCACGKELKKVE